MKKNSIFIFLLLCLPMFGVAQIAIEAKVNPIGIFTGNAKLSAEVIPMENLGIELGYGLASFPFTINVEDTLKLSGGGTGGSLAGKYYFMPDRGGDFFYIGAYTRFSNIDVDIEVGSTNEGTGKYSRAAIGFMTGFKWVSNQNIVFEVGGGIGRTISHQLSLIGGGQIVEDRDINLISIPVINLDARLILTVGYRFGE